MRPCINLAYLYFVCTVQPSIRAVKLGNASPTITNAFVAPNACVIGNVTIGPSSGIFYAAIVRGKLSRD